MTAMKKRMILATLSSLLLCMAACSNKQLPTSEDILTEARAVKTLNAYDEMNCVVYDMKVTPASPKSSIDRFVSDDCVEGAGSFEIRYSFSGNSSEAESVYIQQSGGDYRSDLSFHPLGLSIWVKGNKNNKGTFRFMIIQDAGMFTQGTLHDKGRWQFFEYVDKEVLTQEEWTRVVMPYEAFTFVKGHDMGDNKLMLNRFEGYRIEVTNDEGVMCTGSFCIDNLEQFIVDNEVQIAALTIPKSKAPEIADRLVRAGIKAIWNFAHTDLNVPDDVVVENVHLSESLMRLSYRVCSMQDERERKEREKTV